MKKAALFLSVVLKTSHAINTKEVALYGGCFNKTASDEDNENDGFHCHLSSENCREGEKWYTPMQAVAKGFDKCTCDDDYNNNVYIDGCYSLGTHLVTCATDKPSCGDGDMTIGDRFNSGHIVPDTCGDGSSAFQEPSTSCGKQCLCNFAYTRRDEVIEVASTMYGGCYEPISDTTYCVASSSSCQKGEVYRNPFDKFLQKICPCSKAAVGACLNKSGKKFRYCAFAADSCTSSMQFIDVKALKDSKFKKDCNLCLATWETPPPTPAPTRDAGCVDSLTFRYKDKKNASCVWVSKRVNDYGINMCAKAGVKENCPVVCGECCSDNYNREFKLGRKMKTCRYLDSDWPKDDLKIKLCPRKEVQTICPLTCGRCCIDDLDFTFKDEKYNIRNCEWLASKKKAPIKKYCSDYDVKENCRNTCDNCDQQFME